MGWPPGIGAFELMILSVVGLLLFGKDLPQLVRSFNRLILDVRDTLFRW